MYGEFTPKAKKDHCLNEKNIGECDKGSKVWTSCLRPGNEDLRNRWEELSQTLIKQWDPLSGPHRQWALYTLFVSLVLSSGHSLTLLHVSLTHLHALWATRLPKYSPLIPHKASTPNWWVTLARRYYFILCLFVPSWLGSIVACILFRTYDVRVRYANATSVLCCSSQALLSPL